MSKRFGYKIKTYHPLKIHISYISKSLHKKHSTQKQNKAITKTELRSRVPDNTISKQHITMAE